MIPGIVSGQASAYAPLTMSFIAATGAAFVNSATSIGGSLATPSGVLTGDALMAIVMARSALTPPAGWSLVDSQANTGTITQTLYVYRKDTAGPGDSSSNFTWSQSASGRMGLAYVLARSSNGVVTVSESDGAETDVGSSTAYPHNVTVPSLTADVNSELFLIAMTAEAATAVGTDNTYTATGATARTNQPQADNRLGVLTQARNTGQSNSATGTFTAGSPGTNYYSAITVRLKAGA